MLGFGFPPEEELVIATYFLVAATIGIAVVAFRQIRQLRQSVQEQSKQTALLAKSVTGQTYQAIYDSLLSLDRLFVEKPDLAKIWGKENTLYYISGNEEETKQQWMILLFLDWYRNMFFQTKNGVFPEVLFKEWEAVVRDEVSKSEVIKEYWKKLRNAYGEENEFKLHIDGLLLKDQTSPSS